jgi:hypothetical protein
MSGWRPVATQRRPSNAVSPRLQTRGAAFASLSHEQRHGAPGSPSALGSRRVASVAPLAEALVLAAAVGVVTRGLPPHALAAAAPESPERSASERMNFTR